jgi:HK97 family phage major capsid protein
VTADNRYQGDFIEFLNSRTIFDKLALRDVPANVQIKGQDGASTAYWVGEGKAIPATTSDFFNVTLTPLKLAALAAVSKELLRDSSPAAEQLVRDSLANAAAQLIDTTFLGTAAAVSGAKPAGIFNGVTPVVTSGTDANAVRADVSALVNKFIATKNATGLVWVMHPTQALILTMMRTQLGIDEFKGITPDGGVFFGFPVVLGENVDSNALILLRPADIYKIGDSGIQVDTSTDATIEMSDAPTGALLPPTAASVNMVNMFQSDSVAIKVVRSINYAKRRAGAAQYIADTAYSINTPT